MNEPVARFPVGGSTNDVKITYEGTTCAGSKYNSEEMPTQAGSYKVIFYVAPAENGDWGDMADGQITEIEFEITKKVIEVPTVASVYYTGAEQSATIAEYPYNGENAYEETIIKGTEARTYTVQLALKDNGANYEWEEGKTGEVTFTINQATADLVNLTVTPQTEYVYGNALSFTPSWSLAAELPSEKVTYTYYTILCDMYVQFNGIPEDANTYYVVASIGETTDYAADDSVYTEFTIIPATIADPNLTVDATYEETLADIFSRVEWTNTELGAWAWNDATQSVGNVGKKTFEATFTPNAANKNNYNEVTYDITVNVSQKMLYITVEQTVFTYIEGTEQSIVYKVTDENGKVYTDDVKVDGNTAYINANTYPITLTLNETNYKADELSTTLTINKAKNQHVGESNNSTFTLTATYGQTLAEIEEQLTVCAPSESL